MNPEPNNTLIAAWLVAILGAFAVSIEAGLIAIIGYLGQWAKSLKTIPTPATQIALLCICIGVFAGLHRPAALPPSQEWVGQAAQWALSALGVASLAAGTRGAARTDSK